MSNHINYGKKKAYRLGVFKNLRRQRRIDTQISSNESEPAMEHLTLTPEIADTLSSQPMATTSSAVTAATSRFVFSDVHGRGATARPYDDSIDELASALLGEPTTGNPLPLRPKTGYEANGNRFQRQSDDAPRLPSLNFSPLAPSSTIPVHQDSLSSHLRTPSKGNRPNRVGKHSPTSYSSHTRTGSSRIRLESAQLRRVTGMTRPLPKSNTSFFTARLSPEGSLPSSVSAPLNLVATASLESSKEQCSNEVERKVAAMLAATEALKPSASRAFGPPPSKISRMVSSSSKMFSRAFERLHSKDSGKESKFRSIISHPQVAQEQDAGFNAIGRATIEQGDARRYLTSPTAMRLNEGENLNKEKVRKLLGSGNVQRKPLADNAKTLRSREPSTLEDPFSESTTSRSAMVDRRLSESRGSKGYLVDTFASTPTSINPFGLSLDDDLSGLLSDCPDAASTPRSRVQLRRTDEDNLHLSLERRVAHSEKDGLDSESENLSDDSSIFEKPNARTRRMALRASSQPFYREVLNSVGQAIAVSPSSLSKKHPSPSKAALETLSEEFNRYARAKISLADPKDKSVLEKSFAGSSEHQIPTSGSENRIMRVSSRSNQRNLNALSVKDSNKSHRSAPRSRIPRPIRRMKPFHCPGAPGSMDIDELQWSDEEYYIPPAVRRHA